MNIMSEVAQGLDSQYYSRCLPKTNPLWKSSLSLAKKLIRTKDFDDSFVTRVAVLAPFKAGDLFCAAGRVNEHLPFGRAVAEQKQPSE
ncbi:MAG TPA: hypothetical protein V6C97_02685 [Oculatellaceae cyanobacterium]